MENTPIDKNKERSIVLGIVLLICVAVIWNMTTTNKYKEQVKQLTKTNELLRIPPDTTQITQEKLHAIIMRMQPKLDPILSKEISMLIIRECKVKNMDPALVTGLIFVESKFDPFAESNRGALGLMQIRYSVWKEEPELKGDDIHAKGALFWIDKNIIAGTNILRKYYEESGCNMRATLYRYNTGSPNLSNNSWNEEYVNKVLYYTYWIKTLLTEENKCTVVTPVKKETATEKVSKKESTIKKEAKNG